MILTTLGFLVLKTNFKDPAAFVPVQRGPQNPTLYVLIACPYIVFMRAFYLDNMNST